VDMKDLILDEMKQVISRYTAQASVETRWGEPLVGYASTEDRLFEELKTAVSSEHFMPHELLPKSRTVVAFFLPFHADIPRSNVVGEYPSVEWSRAYVETNDLIAAICAHLKNTIEACGFTVATTPAAHNYDSVTLLSRWSHRHVAYVAGLGAFGLNNMLITRKGCCGRLGSFLMSAAVTPDARAGREACLFKYDGSCKSCVDRCPVEALSPHGFARQLCNARINRNAEIDRPWGSTAVCGKCLVGLPCSFEDPVVRRTAAS